MGTLPKGLKFNRLGHVVPDGINPLPSDPKSMTIKSHAKGLTVNEIMKRFAVTGTIPDRGIPPQFFNTTVIPDLFTALNQRSTLNNYFAGLDAKLRAEFQNDPVNLVKFVNDPRNIDKGVEMGLLKLNEKGLKARADWMAVQAKKKADERQAFVADVSQILKGGGGGEAPPVTK